jgi:hypothetical protein
LPPEAAIANHPNDSVPQDHFKSTFPQKHGPLVFSRPDFQEVSFDLVAKSFSLWVSSSPVELLPFFHKSFYHEDSEIKVPNMVAQGRILSPHARRTLSSK